MANMSYCRFQNTLPDFIDCYEAMDEIGLDDNSISKEEEEAARKLYHWAKRMVEDYEGLFDEPVYGGEL